jgi:hypothetical protein
MATVTVERDTILIDFEGKDRENFDAIPLEEEEWDHPWRGREMTKTSLNGDMLMIFRIYEPKKRHARDRQPEGTV